MDPMIQNQLTNIETLTDSNYSNWKLKIQIALGYLDFDFNLTEVKPANLTDISSDVEKVAYVKWVKTNKMANLIIRSSIDPIMRGSIAERDTANELLDVIKKQFEGSVKGSGNVCSHILKISKLVLTLKELGVTIDDTLMVHLAVWSLPQSFEMFQVYYHNQEKTWEMNELIAVLVSEEERHKKVPDPVVAPVQFPIIPPPVQLFAPTRYSLRERRSTISLGKLYLKKKNILLSLEVFEDADMSCFSCFSSHDKKSSKRVNNIPAYPRESPGRHHDNHKTKNCGDAANKKHGVEKDGNGNIAAQTFTFRELASATKNFRQECLLGEGGFGRVYKGRLENGGQLSAIKQLDRNGLQGNREFLVEVLMLSLLHHQNLVNLIGYCADGDQRLLVYEYMPLGSLEDHLLDLPDDQKPLGWFTRMKIATGAAKGLEYLHDKANPPVIYRDLKASNILLDEEFNPKLSDFGLAKLGPIGDKVHVSSRVMGTYGYCAPEYAMTGQLTLKSDVYSFGVVLLELITGRRAIDTTRPHEQQNLVTWAQPYFKDPNKFPAMADPLLKGEFPVRGLNQAVAVAAMCLQEEATVRPLISDVVTALSFLALAPTAEEGTPAIPVTVPVISPASPDEMPVNEKKDEDSSDERQRAVAEAMEWGSHSREINQKRFSSQGGSGFSL
ncbi:hypothetical protein GIB67_024551 [Kingdonia uniflora]|uniref:non-specific serine/threonine protein kinase n=1 Tax=Kingdonia uniflora TaxID=39325 RepID=A0A7J7LP98_9MAGN|nr:hypothetical protein GIB67_024551 [Kingdonia uniflora]